MSATLLQYRVSEETEDEDWLSRNNGGNETAMKHNKAPDDVVQGLLDRSFDVRRDSIEALCSLLKKPIPELTAKLNDKNDLIRVYAIEALENIGDRSAARLLRKALRDPSSLVRCYAAAAIGALRDDSARTLLQKALLKERSVIARVGLFVGLFLLGDKQRLSALMDLLENKSYRIRCAAANSLAELPLSAAEKRVVVQRLRERLKLETTVAARSSLENAIEGHEHKHGRKIQSRKIQD